MNRTENPVLYPVLKHHKLQIRFRKSNPVPVRIQLTGTGASCPLQAPRLASSAAGVRFFENEIPNRIRFRFASSEPEPAKSDRGLVSSVVGFPHSLPRSRAASASSVSLSRALGVVSFRGILFWGQFSKLQSHCNHILASNCNQRQQQQHNNNNNNKKIKLTHTQVSRAFRQFFSSPPTPPPDLESSERYISPKLPASSSAVAVVVSPVLISFSLCAVLASLPRSIHPSIPTGITILGY